ncbi:alpha/beta hydrolase [Longirhabdus pacifica]|uniref:alpha/beta hydrolase n=1 Tax=Longirhabdus pacifica TaxID=2305227 RepID=UPI001F0CC110|nr:alpha/beta hydrolase [Longirhabdus pacifica]
MSEERFVEIEDMGGRLAGVLHLPDTVNRPCPVIVYCPGKNGERYEVHRLAVKFARVLAKQGIAFLRFDYYGLGLSDGNYYEMTTETKISNVITAYEWLQTCPEIDNQKITFLGFSDGARIALMAANRCNVEHVMLWSPLFYEFSGNLPGKKKPRFQRHHRALQYLVMPWVGMWISMDFYSHLFSIDLDDELRRYKGKSIVIYGDNDPLIQEEFKLMETNQYAVYANDHEHPVYCVAGAGHLFTSVPLEQNIMDFSSQWIQEQWK